MPGLAARGRLTTAASMALVAIGVFLALTALGVGGGERTVRRASPAAAPRAIYHVGAPHVLSSITVYPVGAVFQKPGPQDRPLVASWFRGAIARYRAYSVAQLGILERQIPALRSALAANDRAAAQDAWRVLYSRYLRLGAVYEEGALATLDREIDGSAGGLEGGVASPRFTGLHRIEYGLWTATPPRALLGWADRLDVDVHTLRKALGRAPLTVLQFTTRAHEILEGALRDQLTGAAVPWSGEGVLATKAGLQATEEIISTLRGVFRKDDRALPAVRSEFAALRSAMASIAATHGGRLPETGQLTQSESELLNATLGGALEALAQVPGALETELLPHIAQIPERDIRVQP